MSLRLLPWVLAGVTFLLFSQSLRAGFVEWDDTINLVDNPGYRGLGWTQVRWMFTAVLLGHYIPLTWLSFGLDYTLWGMNPTGYHLTSLLIHAANAALFYLVARRLLRQATTLAGWHLAGGAAVAALFFAVHPLRVESVVWVTERRDLLSAFFLFLTVLTYLEAAKPGNPRRRWLLAVSVGLYLLSVLSKAIVMTLPLVLLVLDVYPLGRLRAAPGDRFRPPTRAVWLEKLPYLAVALFGAAMAVYAHASQTYLTSLQRYPVSTRVANVLSSFWFYVYKTIVPLGLSPLYELPVTLDLFALRVLTNAVSVIGISAVMLLSWRRWPAGLATWAYYGLVLVPVSGLVHAGLQLEADRYSYLSCLGWALLVGAGAGILVRATAQGRLRRWAARLALGGGAVWFLALGALTWQQVGIWRDNESLWRHAVAVNPGCAVCHNSLGNWLLHHGSAQSALDHFEHALALRPDQVKIHGNAGLALVKLGRRPEAVERFRRVVEAYPDLVDARSTLAGTLMQLGRSDEAVVELEEALRRNPRHVGARVNLGLALRTLGRPREAVDQLQRAIELKPDDATTRLGLVLAYMALGETDLARAQYEVLKTVDPRMAGLVSSPASP